MISRKLGRNMGPGFTIGRAYRITERVVWEGRAIFPVGIAEKPVGSLAGVVQALEESLKKTSPDTARRDARLIAMKVCKLERAQFLAHLDRVVTQNELALMSLHVFSRQEGRPMQYVLGEQEFWNLRLRVGHGVLIPRPETEHLVEYVLDAYPESTWLRIADLGTGSGAIALVVAQHYEHARVEAIDISSEALYWARYNVEAYGMEHRIEIIEGDMTTALTGKYDLLLSNPPYIASSAIGELVDGINFEPRIALDGGEDGLEFYRLLARLAKQHLNAGGRLVVEIGADQQSDVERIFAGQGLVAFEALPDLAGIPRVLVAKRV